MPALLPPPIASECLKCLVLPVSGTWRLRKRNYSIGQNLLIATAQPLQTVQSNAQCLVHRVLDASAVLQMVRMEESLKPLGYQAPELNPDVPGAVPGMRRA